MKANNSAKNTTLEIVSPNVQISENYIETDYTYQTSNVKRLANGKIQVSLWNKESINNVN